MLTDICCHLSDAVRPRVGVNACKNSAIVFNATLSNGYQSGEFMDHGDVGLMSACQALCCRSYTCDVAFMAGKRCFSVRCHSEEQCQWLPAKGNKFILQLSYISGVRSVPNTGKSINRSARC